MSEEIVAAAPGWSAGVTGRHWRILWASFLGWIFDGYEAYALILALPMALKSILTPAQAQTPSLYFGAAISITLLGWGIGGLAGGILADYIGRKRTMMLAVFFYALFTGVTAFTQSFAQLAALRFITGFAIGSEWSTGVALVAETWPNRARPIGCGFLQSGFGWGSLLAAIVWFLLSLGNPLGAESWRLLFAVGALPALCVLYLRRALNESEQWLQAVRDKRWASVAGAEEILSDGGARPFTLVALLSSAEGRRRIALTVLLSIATTSGWWAVSSWLPALTEQMAKAQGLGAGIWGPRMAIIYTTGAVAAYLLSGFIAEALGRRLYLFLVFAGSLAVTLLTYLWSGGFTPFIAIAFLNGFFTLGMAYSWMAIYPVELFTPTVRATACSFIFNAARLIACLFPLLAGSIVQYFGGIVKAALIIGSVYLLGLAIPWFLPETRGQKLPE
jgi:predicted MFS family arabinose efflux permease